MVRTFVGGFDPVIIALNFRRGGPTVLERVRKAPLSVSHIQARRALAGRGQRALPHTVLGLKREAPGSAADLVALRKELGATSRGYEAALRRLHEHQAELGRRLDELEKPCLASRTPVLDT